MLTQPGGSSAGRTETLLESYTVNFVLFCFVWPCCAACAIVVP